VIWAILWTEYSENWPSHPELLSQHVYLLTEGHYLRYHHQAVRTRSHCPLTQVRTVTRNWGHVTALPTVRRRACSVLTRRSRGQWSPPRPSASLSPISTNSVQFHDWGYLSLFKFWSLSGWKFWLLLYKVMLNNVRPDFIKTPQPSQYNCNQQIATNIAGVDIRAW